MRIFNNEKKIIVLNRKKLLLFLVFMILILATFYCYRIFDSYSTQLKEMMKIKSNNAFQKAVNEAVIDVGNNYKFVDIVYDNGLVCAVNYNTADINTFKAEVVKKVLQSVNNDKLRFRIFLTDAFKNPLFLNKGPYFDVYCTPHNGIKIECFSKFEGQGVNQTKNSIWFEIVTDVYSSSEVFNTLSNFKYTVLVSETVIVGQVPESYTNVAGDEKTKDTVLNLQ